MYAKANRDNEYIDPRYRPGEDPNYEENDYGGYAGHYNMERDYEEYDDNYRVVDSFQQFVTHLYEAIAQGDMYEITKIYENKWPQLIEEDFKTSMLPEKAEIAHPAGGDPLFLILYQELYYRHIHANLGNQLSIAHRFEAYKNYCNLFNYLLANDPVRIDLPYQWLWDIIHEYIYQYEEFQKFVEKCKESMELTSTLSRFFEASPRTWQPMQLINVLLCLSDKSNIRRQLDVLITGGNPDLVAGEYGKIPIYKMLGYFSLIGLLKLNTLFGDYYQAIKSVNYIELDKISSNFARFPGCHVSMYYYVGFCYMMMKRYDDAIRTFSNVLVYLQRTKGLFQTKSYQNDLINKQSNKMSVLLSMCLVLYPKRIDESLRAILFQTSTQENRPGKENNYLDIKNYLDIMNNMQAGDLSEFEACFAYACPKFLSPVPPALDDKKDQHDALHKEPLRLQQKVFMDEVRQQTMLPTIRSYLKLYTSMPMDKLAKYMGTDAEDYKVDALEGNLLCFKHKMMNLVWTKGTSGLEGEFQAESEVDFYIDKNMIHIADTKVDRRYGDFFIRQIHKFEELNRGLKTIKM